MSTETTFISLIQNVALLLAIAVLFDLAAVRRKIGQAGISQFITGIILGAMGIVLMMTPWVFTPGIIFDTRSVLLGISGLFFGVIPTGIAMLMTVVFRYQQGGAAAWAGIMVILATGSIGLLWRHFRRGTLQSLTWRELYLFGIVLHITMLLIMLTLPWETAQQVLAVITAPVLIIYPVGTTLLGLLMVNRLHREQVTRSLKINEIRLKSLVEILQQSSATTTELLKYALDEAVKLTESKIGYIFLYDDALKKLTLDAWSTDVMAECKIVDPPNCFELSETGLWGEAVRQAKPIMLNDFQSHNPLKHGLPAGHVPLRKFLTVPIFSENKIVAVIGVANKETDYEEADVLQLTLLMNTVWKVAERQRAGEALRQSEARNQAIISGLPNGIIHILDRNMRYVYNVGEELTRLGLSNEMLVGKSIFDMLEPTLAEKVTEHYQRVLQGEDVRFEGDYGGQTFLIHAAPLRQANGMIDQILALSINISERKQAEKQILAAQQDLQMLLTDAEDSRRVLLNLLEDQRLTEDALRKSTLELNSFYALTPDFLCVLTIEGLFVRYNQSWETIFGYSAEEMIPGILLDFIHPDDVPVTQSFLADLVDNGTAASFTTRFRRKDGAYRWLEWRGQLSGEFIFGAARDITERKQTEETLALQTEELARRNFELGRLYRNSQSLIRTTPFDVEALAKTIVETVTSGFGISNCALYQVNPTTQAADCLAITGEFDRERSNSIRLDSNELVAQAIRSAQAVYVADVLLEPGYEYCCGRARSELVVPLSINERVIGAIAVPSTQPNAFSADDQRLLVLFASQAAIVLDNTNLAADARTQVERLEALRSIDETINASLDLGVTTEMLLRQVKLMLRVDAVDILLLDSSSKTLRFVDGNGFTTAALRQTNLRLGQGLAGQAALNRQIIHIPDLDQKTDLFAASPQLKDEKFVEYFGVPLIAKGAVRGVLEIFHRTALNTSASWLDFMTTLAGQAAIAVDNIAMFESLQRSNNELTLAYDENIEGWSRSLDLRDKETEGHTQRVAEITMRLAMAAGITGTDLVHVRWGALLHDIGKMGIPDRILFKPGPLSDEEWEIMRKHPVYAYELLSPIAFLGQALDIPYCHHEKWDGSGYPRGLKGEQIPLSARLFTLADVWDALRSDRPYRKAWEESQVLDYIRELSGKQFDPQLVELFNNLIPDVKYAPQKPTLLIVEHDEAVLASLVGGLQNDYNLLTALTGEDALEIARHNHPVLVVTAQHLPGLKGVELLTIMQQEKPKTMGILMADDQDTGVLITALNLANVRGFVSRPVEIEELREKIAAAIGATRV